MGQVRERRMWWLFLSRKQGGGGSEKPLEASGSGSQQLPNQSECRDTSPPLCIVSSGENEGRTPAGLLFVISRTGQMFYSPHVQEQPASFIPGGIHVTSPSAYCRAALPLRRAGRGVVPLLLLLGHMTACVLPG